MLWLRRVEQIQGFVPFRFVGAFVVAGRRVLGPVDGSFVLVWRFGLWGRASA